MYVINTRFSVKGMSCAHCENAVKTALLALGGVSSVMVDPGSGYVTVIHDGTVTIACLVSAVEDQGFSVNQL